MKWVKASERMPSFMSDVKIYLTRYGNIPDEWKVFTWDKMKDLETAGYDIEWLDESDPDPYKKIEFLEKCLNELDALNDPTRNFV